MPNTGNQVLTNLVELTAQEVQPDDVFLIVDVNANESKQIQAYELAAWLNASGSLYAIYAINAENASTASYILGSGVYGLVLSASYSNTSSFSNTTLFVNSSSYALSSSYAANVSTASITTASYLLYLGTPNGTASYALNSSNSLVSNVSFIASNLNYPNTSTALYAVTAQNATNSINASTASYLNSTIGSVATASYANFAASTPVGSSSYLIYTPFGSNNGTASCAIVAKSIANVMLNYGIFPAFTQSTFESQLDDVDILWSTGLGAPTPIEAMGTMIIPFTASYPTTGTIYLATIDRNTGFETMLDITPLTTSISSIMGSYGNYGSGTIEMPFSLMGQSNYYGSYIVFVSSSNNIILEPSRSVRFKISSNSDTVNVYPTVPLIFSAYSSPPALFTFTSNAGGPFTDYSPGLVISMSAGSQSYTLNAINQMGLTSINYFWTLTGITASNFSYNLLSRLSGVPNSLTYLSCSNCFLSSFYSFQSSSLTTLNCSSNSLVSLPNFPQSMSYINCSSNQLTSLNLPVTLSYLNCSSNQLTSISSLPSGSTVFLADSNQIQSLPYYLPNTLVTMSANNNTSLNLSTTVLSTQLGYLSLNYCPNMGAFPSLLSSSITYLSLQSCSLGQFNMQNITATLSASGIVSGNLDIRGNGPPNMTTNGYIQILKNNGWNVLQDF